MPAPMRWDTKIILAKIETTYGTDAAPVGATNAILMKNVEIRPMEGEDVARNVEQPFMSAEEDFPTGLRVVLSGEVELAPSGTAGTAPNWGPLLRACGVAEVVTAATKVEYTPVTAAQEAVTIHVYIDTTRHVMLGSRGTCEIVAGAQGLPALKFTFTGLWATPSNQTRPSVTLTGFKVPEVVSDTNTPDLLINAVSFVTRDFNFNLGCNVQPRLLVNRESIVIEDKKGEMISATVEAVPIGTFDPYTIAKNRTLVPVSFTHGSAAGKIFNFTATNAVLKRLEGYANAQNIAEWPLKLQARPTAGDDQWKITLT